MRTSLRSIHALLIGIGVFAPVSCGGGTVRPPLGGMEPALTNAAHQRSAVPARLLYAAGPVSVAILTYPGGKSVGIITDVVPTGLCTDAGDGNVWIVTQFSDGFYAYKFAHGATTPTAEVKIPGALLALGCAVDSSTHDLAVGFLGYDAGQPFIAVWPAGMGTPAVYTPPFSPQSLVYDDNGNLFTSGDSVHKAFAFAELPRGGKTFTNVHLDRPATVPGGLGWDGRYVVVGYGARGDGENFQSIYRVRIRGWHGHVVGTHEFEGLPKRNSFWLQGDTIIAAPQKSKNGDAFWHYPRGGEPFKTGVGTFNAYYVAVSVAASTSLVRSEGACRRFRAVGRC